MVRRYYIVYEISLLDLGFRGVCRNFGKTKKRVIVIGIGVL